MCARATVGTVFGRALEGGGRRPAHLYEQDIMLCYTRPQTCPAFRPTGADRNNRCWPTGTEFPRMAAAAENSTGDTFRGMYFLIPPRGNWQTIKIIYDCQQLQKSLYPAFKSAFRAHGFDEVPWEDLLKVLTVGGEVDLKGKKFINRPAYDPHTMDSAFMRRDRALVSELMTIVFETADNVSYMRELAPCEVVATSLEFDASIALRKTTMLYHALDGHLRDTYRIIIEGAGTGANLRVHRFKFQPSRYWHCQRYPENVE